MVQWFFQQSEKYKNIKLTEDKKKPAKIQHSSLINACLKRIVLNDLNDTIMVIKLNIVLNNTVSFNQTQRKKL